MQIFQNLADARLSGPTVLTIGTFDGVHRGHQDLLEQLKAAAHTLNAQSVVLAFHPRPKTVLVPHHPGNDYLTTPKERISLFETQGLDALILTPFTLELAQTTARNFIQVLSERLNLAQLCVGHDFALGKNREGDVHRLAELGQEFGYTVREIDPFKLDGQVVSSTQVRQRLLAGDVRGAAYLLGRYPSLNSHIVQGARRGHAIGFPTANFAVPAERLLPANGVYATFFRRAGGEQTRPSVTNVGVRPSFGEDARTVETYIFDFDETIYGQSARLEFVERLRPEKKFNGIEALKARIARDCAQARALLAKEVTTRMSKKAPQARGLGG